MPPRKTAGDQRAARTQLRTADPDARVPKASRAKDNAPDKALTVPLGDREFRLADDVGIMPLMEWAAAIEDSDSENASSLVAVFHVLADTVHPDDWTDFRQYCRDNKVQSKDLGDFINASMEALAGRPTEEPTGS